MAVNLEAMIDKNMRVLGISREEAIALIASDAEIDRMTSTKQIDGDLSAEQRKNAKGARQADRKPSVFKFDTSKRKKAENLGKQKLIEVMRGALAESGCTDMVVTNNEREFSFVADGVKYKVVMSVPRS